MAIISEAQLLALFRDALKAGWTFGTATSHQLAIWGLKITYIFKVQSDDPHWHGFKKGNRMGNPL